MEIIESHICKTCNKTYSSYSSLWNHNKNIHKNADINKQKITKKEQEITKNIYNCKYCNKIYNIQQSKWYHEQKCKVIFDEKEQETQNNEIKIAEINKEIKLAEIELEKINANKEIKLAEINREIELKKLEIKKENTIVKQKTNSNPTIKNINKLLRAQNKIKMNNSNLTSNSNNTNIQNNIVNNFKIEGFGKENILDVITDKEKKLIINQGFGSIEKLIEITNAGKYDQFKNIIVTNKRDNDIYMYDEKSGSYINNDKQLILNKLVLNRLDDIEEIYNEFDENNKLTESNRKILSKFFLKFIDENKEYIDENTNKVFKNFIEFKINKVNNLLFNNQDKIIQDVTLAIENNNKDEDK